MAVACLNMSIVVTVPYYNESEGILETLEDINNQQHRADKVIFVDSGSTDNTSDIINDWIIRNNKKNYENVFSGKMSPSTSINTAIELSDEDLIAYIDCGLSIPSDWILTSIKLIEKSNADMISTMIYTNGINKIDKVFVSQTYGYKNFSICLPGSIIKRSVFRDIGMLMPNVRASYDIDFIKKFSKKNLTRQLNNQMYLKYQDINYTNSFINGFKKVYAYSLNAWSASGDIKPFIYFLLLFILLFLLTYSHYTTIYYFLSSYLVLRAIIIPMVKSFKSINLIFSSSLFHVIIAGLIIDIARISGYVRSIFSNLGMYNDKKN